MAVEVWANAATGIVTAGGTNAPAPGTVQTWTVNVSAAFAVASTVASPQTQFYAADPLAPGEVFLVTVAPGGTGSQSWTVTRGADGTTPTTHALNFQVIQATARATLQVLQRPWLVRPSGDGTGVADSTAFAGAAAGYSHIELVPFATYTTNSTTNLGVGQHLYGPGLDSPVINWIGTGDCFRQTFNGVYNGTTTVGGGITGVTIDGTSSGAGSAGIHAGDIASLTYDRTYVRNFTGVGSIGYHFDNAVNFTERLSGRIEATNNTSGVVFDVSGATTSTASFARCLLDIYVTTGAVTRNGVVFQNGAQPYHGRIGIRGNFTGGASGAPGAALVITGSVPAGHPGAGAASNILECQLDIGCESSAGVVLPQTISLGSSSNNFGGYGSMNFTGAGWKPSNVLTAGAAFVFSGPIAGDATLVAVTTFGTQPQGAIITGGTIISQQGGNVSVNPAGAVTGIIIQPGIDGQQLTVVNLSGNLVTFAVAGTSHVAAGASATVPANTSRLFVWNGANSLWYGGV